MATGNLMKWGESICRTRGGGGGSDGATCEPESQGENGESRISWGGKLVAQWGFLLEFNFSGGGRKGRREGR